MLWKNKLFLIVFQIIVFFISLFKSKSIFSIFYTIQDFDKLMNQIKMYLVIAMFHVKTIKSLNRRKD